ncbi:MAG: PDZ domain-containing protein [Deltaproteobacteria bacterium]|nr:PDZ domain-containing protein [Deltaproteobacteria bacterium]
MGLSMVRNGGRVVVDRVEPAGPAAAAGIKIDDQVLTVGRWSVTEDTDVEALQASLTGPTGSSLHIEVDRSGQVLPFQLARSPLDTIYAGEHLVNVQLWAGTVLQAQVANEWFALRVLEPRLPPDRRGRLQMYKTGALDQIRYQWWRTRLRVAMRSPHVETGIATVDKDAAEVEVGPWRVVLKRLVGVWLACWTSLPVRLGGRDWSEQSPPWHGMHYLRADSGGFRCANSVEEQRQQWSVGERASPFAQPRRGLHGARPVRVRLLGDGKPLSNQRFRFELDVGRRAILPGPTAVTDGKGEALVRLPAGTYFVRGLLPADPGPHRDVALAQPGWRLAKTGDASAAIETAGGPAVTVELVRDATTAAGLADDPTESAPRSDRGPPGGIELVGKPMPELEVLRWLAPPMASGVAKPRLFAVCMFASERADGAAFAALCSEVQARIGGEGVTTVLASLDRSWRSIQSTTLDWVPGHPAVAWLGPNGRSIFATLPAAALVLIRGDGVVCSTVGAGASVDRMLEAARRCL